MFNRPLKIAVSALMLGSLSGVAFAAETVDTKPIVQESCARPMLAAASRITGHPGRAAPARKRVVNGTAECRSEQSRPMILASYTDAAGGLALVRGNTERALGQIARKSARGSTLVLTNQCVAQTVLRQWSDARASCDAALAAANAERLRGGTRFEASRRMADTAVAVAYSNRAVLNWLTDNAIAAHNDMIQARSLAPGARYVTRNLLVTERAPALVRSTGDHAPIG